MATMRTGTGRPSLFAADTAVQALGDGRFTAAVSDRWNGLAGRPLGGYVHAVALRALREAMPFPDLLVASAFFLNPVEPGPVEIRTEIARAGRRSSTGEARLSQHGREALRTVATFTVHPDQMSQHLIGTRPPELPLPDAAAGLNVGDPLAVSIAGRVEYRVAGDPGHRQRQEPKVPRISLWMRLKEGGGADPVSLPFLVDAAPPAVLDIGATGSTTLELTTHVRGRPASQWLACRATTRCVVGGYHEEDFEIWDERGTLVAQSRQIARLPATDTIDTTVP
jgi:acyl-CoA thioesterase